MKELATTGLKKERAIVALLAKPTLGAAAKAADISEVTLWRWMKEPDFKARLKQAQAKCRQRTRCAACRDWPPARILTIDADGVETWQDPDLPEACLRCGWAPVVVEIVEVREWERVGQYGLF
jgi:hypothetical protein